jgi:gas vesicle protein
MAEGPKTGLRNVILVWVIGLTLGVAAGAATAMLLMPGNSDVPQGASLGDRMRRG